LTPLELGILGCIDNMPGIDQRRMADRMAIDAVTAGQRVDHLHTMGYVIREIDPEDRRVRRLRLTPEGRKFRLRIRPTMRAAHARTLEPLAEREQETLYNLLERVILSHEAYAKPGNGRRRPGKKQSSKKEKARRSS
jgi:DNA-binding MarR family transcriptional regulator